MRIITGDYKGRRLYTPQGNNIIRPTTDKVKEAIFSIIQEYIDEAMFIDMFAGTGNLGLEALSRGADHCYFCDSNRESINLIKKNIEYCRAEAKSTVLAGDYSKNIVKIGEDQSRGKHEKADVILLDPPYKKGLMIDCIERICDEGILAEDGIIVAEHGSDEELPEKIRSFEIIKERKYASIVITLYGYSEEM